MGGRPQGGHQVPVSRLVEGHKQPLPLIELDMMECVCALTFRLVRLAEPKALYFSTTFCWYAVAQPRDYDCLSPPLPRVSY
jgi:hypothetical protein